MHAHTHAPAFHFPLKNKQMILYLQHSKAEGEAGLATSVSGKRISILLQP